MLSQEGTAVRDSGIFVVSDAAAAVMLSGLLSAVSCGGDDSGRGIGGANDSGASTGGVAAGGGGGNGGANTGGASAGGTGGTSRGTGGDATGGRGNAGDASVGGAGAGGGGTCNPESCPLPIPTPPTVKCCFSPSGPCGYDFGQGAGCQVPFVGDM